MMLAKPEAQAVADTMNEWAMRTVQASILRWSELDDVIFEAAARDQVERYEAEARRKTADAGKEWTDLDDLYVEALRRAFGKLRALTTLGGSARAGRA